MLLHMSTELWEGTGEHLPVRSSVFDTVPMGVFGEREDIRGRFDAQSVHDAASVPFGQFIYGRPFDRWATHVPRQPLYGRPTLSPHALLDFMDTTHGSVSRDQATATVRVIHSLLESPQPSGRIAVFEAPFKRWVQSDHALLFAAAVRRLYGVHDGRDRLRDDAEDVHGTEVWQAWAGTVPFWLMIRSRISGKEIRRRMEAIKCADPSEAFDVLDEPSLQEGLRTKLLLDQVDAEGWRVTPQERLHIYGNVNRRTVRHDQDTMLLLVRLRQPHRPGAYASAVRHLGRVLNFVPRRSTAPADS